MTHATSTNDSRAARNPRHSSSGRSHSHPIDAGTSGQELASVRGTSEEGLQQGVSSPDYERSRGQEAGGSEESLPSQEEAQTFVGFYGCSRRLVRVGWRGEGSTSLRRYTVGQFQLNPRVKRPKQNHDVDCPACGLRHRVGITWKKLLRNNGSNVVVLYDSGREPDLWLSPDD